MTGREVRWLTVVDGILKSYQSRAHSENWAQWAEKNPQLSRLLNEAQRLAEDE